MSAATDWQTAFVAVGALLSEPEPMAPLGEDVPARVAELARALSSTSREVRARAVARAVTAVVADVERARLA
jgi:hypothetical protein